MVNSKDCAWSAVRDSEILLKVFGQFPSFHDASVLSICMERAKRMKKNDPQSGLVDLRRLELVDVIFEVLHREHRSTIERIERPDYAVTIALLDVRSVNIDINAMLDDSRVSEIILRLEPDGLLGFKIEPDVGFDVEVICVAAEIRGVRPFRDAVLIDPDVVVFP